MRSLLMAALLALPVASIAEPKQGEVVFVDYFACGQLVMHLILEPEKEPLIVRGYQSEADKDRIMALWREAEEAGNTYEYHVHNAKCQRT